VRRCTYIYTQTYTHTHTFTCTRVHTFAHVVGYFGSVHTYADVRRRTHTHAYTHSHSYTHTHAHLHIHAHSYSWVIYHRVARYPHTPHMYTLLAHTPTCICNYTPARICSEGPRPSIHNTQLELTHTQKVHYIDPKTPTPYARICTLTYHTHTHTHTHTGSHMHTPTTAYTAPYTTYTLQQQIHCMHAQHSTHMRIHAAIYACTDTHQTPNAHARIHTHTNIHTHTSTHAYTPISLYALTHRTHMQTYTYHTTYHPHGAFVGANACMWLTSLTDGLVHVPPPWVGQRF